MECHKEKVQEKIELWRAGITKVINSVAVLPVQMTDSHLKRKSTVTGTKVRDYRSYREIKIWTTFLAAWIKRKSWVLEVLCRKKQDKV